MKFAIHLAEVPNHEETKAVLATSPDRIGEIIITAGLTSIICLEGHGTCIHPSLGGSEELWQQLLLVRCPVEVRRKISISSNSGII